jgi:hypothetical protein
MDVNHHGGGVKDAVFLVDEVENALDRVVTKGCDADN